MQVPAAKIYFSEEDKKDISAKVEEILTTGQLTLGKYGKQFEEEFARYVGAKYAVAVSSGTSALEIILRTLDIQGYSVIVPTNTFFATPAAVLHAGGKVEFADVTENLCLDPESVKKKISRDTKGVSIVHIGGVVPPQVKQIQEICQARDLFLIEDAAHVQGSMLDGKMAGSFGIAAAFSFYPTKVMTSGEGGMITTNDIEEILLASKKGAKIEEAPVKMLSREGESEIYTTRNLFRFLTVFPWHLIRTVWRNL